MTTPRLSLDAAILVLLCQRSQATAAEIGIICRMTAGEVRSRLASLESRRLVTGRHDARFVLPARAFAITSEGLRRVKP